VADIAALTAAFNAADAAGDTAAAQQLHDALDAAMKQTAAPAAPAAPAIAPAESAAQGFGHVASMGLDASAGGLIRKAMNDYVDPLLYAALNPNEPGSFGDRMDAYGAARDAGPLHSLNDYVQNQKQHREAAYEANPRNYIEGGILGAALSGAGAAENVAGQTLREAVPQLMKQGAAIGATFGAGAATEQDANTTTLPQALGNAAINMGTGAVTGAVISGAVPTVLQGVANAAGSIGRMVGKLVGKSDNVNAAAVKELGAQMRAHGLTPESLKAAYDRNPNLVLADFMPSTVGEIASTGSGPGRTALSDFAQQREDTALRALAPVLRKAMGLDDTSTSYLLLQKQLQEAKIAQAAPLYQQAEQTPMEITPTMQKLLSHPKVAPIWNDAGKELATRFEPLAPDVRVNPPPTPSPNPEPTSDFSMFRPTPPDPGSPTTGPNLINRLKITLSNLGDTGARLNNPNSQNYSKATASDYFTLKRALKTELDRANPAFAQATRVYGDKAEMQDAAELGLKVFAPGTKVDTIVHEYGAMSEAAQDSARIAAMSDLEHRLGNVADAQTGVRQILGTENLRAKLVWLFGDEAKAKSVNTLLMDRTRMHEMFQATLRAPTAINAPASAGGALVGQGVTQGILPGVPGAGYFGRVVGGRTMGRLLGRQEGLTNDAMAGLMMSRDPAAANQAIQAGLLSPTNARLGATSGILGAQAVPGLLDQLQQ
jgi:hypothetical protein